MFSTDSPPGHIQAARHGQGGRRHEGFGDQAEAQEYQRQQ